MKERELTMEISNRRGIIVLPIVLIVAPVVAWAGSLEGYVITGFPIFALCVALSFMIQGVAFIPAFIKQTEKSYDLVGGITYLSGMECCSSHSRIRW